MRSAAGGGSPNRCGRIGCEKDGRSDGISGPTVGAAAYSRRNYEDITRVKESRGKASLFELDTETPLRHDEQIDLPLREPSPIDLLVALLDPDKLDAVTGPYGSDGPGGRSTGRKRLAPARPNETGRGHR